VYIVHSDAGHAAAAAWGAMALDYAMMAEGPEWGSVKQMEPCVRDPGGGLPAAAQLRGGTRCRRHGGR